MFCFNNITEQNNCINIDETLVMNVDWKIKWMQYKLFFILNCYLVKLIKLLSFYFRDIFWTSLQLRKCYKIKFSLFLTKSLISSSKDHSPCQWNLLKFFPVTRLAGGSIDFTKANSVAVLITWQGLPLANRTQFLVAFYLVSRRTTWFLIPTGVKLFGETISVQHFIEYSPQ